MTYATYADYLKPGDRRHALLYDLLLMVGGSLLIGLSAQIAIPLPFSPVPITGQTLTVLLAGAVLGRRRGSLCILTYLVEGLSGLPVFAGGSGGMAHLLGPTGGYLVGFIAAAYLTGWLAEQGWDRHPGTTFLMMALGNLAIYSTGVLGLSAFVGVSKALAMGLYPFVIGDGVKLAIATAILPFGWKRLNPPQR